MRPSNEQRTKDVGIVFFDVLATKHGEYVTVKYDAAIGSGGEGSMPARAVGEKIATRAARMACAGLLGLAGAFACPATPVVAAPAAAPAHVPDFSGLWSQNTSNFISPKRGPGPVTHFPGMAFLYRQDRARGLKGLNVWVGDYTNPILKPWAAAAVKAHGDKGMETGEPLPELLQYCLLVGVPHILLLRDPVQFLQQTDQVTILYQRDQQVRHVYLNKKHPAHITPSAYGNSVGWYDGDTLVVDTVGMTNVGPIDYYGTPHTDQLHVIERYRVVDGGKTLEVRFTVDDQGAFTEKWTGIQRYKRVHQDGLQEYRCAENPKDFHGEYAIPMDHTPDF